MDFALTETQVEIKDLAARVLADYTTQEQLRELDNTGYFSQTLWAQLAATGLLGVAIPEEHGGMGFDFETLCVLLEEAGRRAAPLPLVDVLVQGVWPLQQFAAPALLAELLPRIAAGELLLTAATREPFHGATGLQTQATEVAGQWRISGSKCGVGAIQEAGFVWVSAVIAGAQGPETGIFLLPLPAKEVTIWPQTQTNGQISGLVEFTQAAATLVVRGEQALALLALADNVTMVANAAVATGLCDELIRLASEYTTERVQFGRPIGSFQAVAHTLADCFIDAECLRGVKEQAVCRLLDPEPDAAVVTEAARVAAYWTAEALHRVSHRAQHVHGGAGVDRDYPLFRYCLWARQLQLAFGGSAPVIRDLGRMLVA